MVRYVVLNIMSGSIMQVAYKKKIVACSNKGGLNR